MLSRRRIEPMPTENQCVSRVKNIENHTTLTPRPPFKASLVLLQEGFFSQLLKLSLKNAKSSKSPIFNLKISQII